MKTKKIFILPTILEGKGKIVELLGDMGTNVAQNRSDGFNEISKENKAASLVVKSKDGQRSFKVEVAPPEGQSFAKDIAEMAGSMLSLEENVTSDIILEALETYMELFYS